MNIFLRDIATYSSSANYEYNRKQIPSDTWVVDIDGIISYETFSQDKCIPLKSEFYTEDSCKISFLFSKRKMTLFSF